MFKPTIGLEIHSELNTDSKLFCSCKNNPEEVEANKNVCPICLGYPGTLPVLNKKAVKYILNIGESIKGKKTENIQFDRKHYFYPDIPKGYQISQNKFPLIVGGELLGVDVTRIHLEEDTAKNVHDNKSEGSLVDFNRSGVPLMELVTEPVIHDSKVASSFAQELQLILQHLGVSKARMERGEMRVEANVSVSKNKDLGTKVEIKNLNSFKSVEGAIEYEIVRQTDLLENGEKVIQETRGWDEGQRKTFSQRSKETAKEYRYLREYDLSTFDISKVEYWNEKTDFESLNDKRGRYKKLGIKEKDIEILIRDLSLSKFFDDVCEKCDPKLALNYLLSDVKDLSKITTEGFVEIINMIKENEISSRGAKDILTLDLSSKSPRTVAEEKGLFQKSDPDELNKIIDKVISENISVAEEYKGGKEMSLKFLIGQVMKESKGSANPQVTEKLLKEKLEV